MVIFTVQVIGDVENTVVAEIIYGEYGKVNNWNYTSKVEE